MGLLNNIIRWAKITKASDDTQQFATQQMEYLGKVADGIIVFPYGVHANVPPGALALMFSVQGNAENRAAIAWTPKNRPQLKEGECAFYHPPTKAFIIWRENGDLDIETGEGGKGNVNVTCKQANVTASESITLDAPEATITGNLTVDQNLNVTGATALSATVTSNGKDISDTHTHDGSPTAPTGPLSPTGVVI